MESPLNNHWLNNLGLLGLVGSHQSFAWNESKKARYVSLHKPVSVSVSVSVPVSVPCACACMCLHVPVPACACACGCACTCLDLCLWLCLYLPRPVPGACAYVCACACACACACLRTVTAAARCVCACAYVCVCVCACVGVCACSARWLCLCLSDTAVLVARINCSTKASPDCPSVVTCTAVCVYECCVFGSCRAQQQDEFVRLQWGAGKSIFMAKAASLSNPVQPKPAKDAE